MSTTKQKEMRQLLKQKKWAAQGVVRVATKAEREHRRQQAYRKDRTVKRPTKWANNFNLGGLS